MSPESPHGLTDEELADLARLVDGTLPDERRAEIEARVAASPELARIVQSQALTREALRGTAATTGASARLRAQVERRRSASRAPRRLASARRAAIAATAAAAVAAALALPDILSSGLSVAEAASLAQRPPTQGAPAGMPGTPQLLSAAVENVPFPNFGPKFGWNAVGLRRDKRDGHAITTVYYEKDGRTMAYSIVSGSALGDPSNARVTGQGGKDYRTFRSGGRTVVTWERNGHTCVLSADRVGRAELVALADWRGKGAIPF